MRWTRSLAVTVLTLGLASTGGAQVVEPVKGRRADMVLVPPATDTPSVQLAQDGARDAHAELENPGELASVELPRERGAEGQIEALNAATAAGAEAVMLSNAAGNQMVPAAVAARNAGTRVVTWDASIPSAEGEALFVAPVDFAEIGTVLAGMAGAITGGEGEIAVLSSSRDAANQNDWIAALRTALDAPDYDGVRLVATVYGDDDPERSREQALALVDTYPDLELILAPTTIGMKAAAEALAERNTCDRVVVSGLGVPAEMAEHTRNGCVPQFAFWNYADLGYLTYHVAYLLATRQILGEVGESFEAGRLGTRTIEQDPNRRTGKRVVLGPFTIYNRGMVEDMAE